jgi:hypothetical protein
MQCFGTYGTRELAARAYDLGSILLYGNDAVLNFILTDYVDLSTGEIKEKLPWDVPPAVYEVAAKASKLTYKTE